MNIQCNIPLKFLKDTFLQERRSIVKEILSQCKGCNADLFCYAAISTLEIELDTAHTAEDFDAITRKWSKTPLNEWIESL